MVSFFSSEQNLKSLLNEYSQNQASVVVVFSSSVNCVVAHVASLTNLPVIAVEKEFEQSRGTSFLTLMLLSYLRATDCLVWSKRCVLLAMVCFRRRSTC